MLNIKAKETISPAVESEPDMGIYEEGDPWVNVDEVPPVPSEPQKVTTMKKIVWACLLNGLAWVWCSYILAALDKVQIAESLSQVAITEIIGVVLVYAIKSVLENLSKNNSWPDKHGSVPFGEMK